MALQGNIDAMNNYAWYRLVKKINLEEALLMIAEAIRLDPNDREKSLTHAAFLLLTVTI